MWALGDLTWQDGTQACHGTDIDPEWFFSEDHKTQLQVTRICHQCPLIADCREYALNNRVDGVWGGLTERNLIDERKRLGITPKPISGDLFFQALGVLKNYEKRK